MQRAQPQDACTVRWKRTLFTVYNANSTSSSLYGCNRANNLYSWYVIKNFSRLNSMYRTKVFTSTPPLIKIVVTRSIHPSTDKHFSYTHLSSDRDCCYLHPFTDKHFGDLHPSSDTHFVYLHPSDRDCCCLNPSIDKDCLVYSSQCNCSGKTAYSVYCCDCFFHSSQLNF